MLPSRGAGHRNEYLQRVGIELVRTNVDDSDIILVAVYDSVLLVDIDAGLDAPVSPNVSHVGGGRQVMVEH